MDARRDEGGESVVEGVVLKGHSRQYLLVWNGSSAIGFELLETPKQASELKGPYLSSLFEALFLLYRSSFYPSLLLFARNSSVELIETTQGCLDHSEHQ